MNKKKEKLSLALILVKIKNKSTFKNMNTLVEIIFFIFYMINISKADNFTVNNWFNISTTGLIVKICSKNLPDSNQTEFNFTNNTNEWGSYKIDLSNSEIPNYSMQLNTLSDGCFDDLTFDFINEKFPPVNVTYYTVYCELIKFRYNLSNSSQIETHSVIITRYDLCDRLSSNYYIYEDSKKQELLDIKMKTMKKLNEIDEKYSVIKSASTGVSYLSIVIISLFVFRILLFDIQIIFEVLNKKIIGKRLNQRVMNNSNNLEQSVDSNSNIYRRVIKMNNSIFNHSYFQKRRNMINQALPQ
jgi:hypothetical protein